MIKWEDPEPDGTQGHMEEMVDYVINEMRRRASGSSMDKETWKLISPEGQGEWDKLTSADKAKILSYAKQRAAKTSDGTMETNVHAIKDDASDTPPEESAAQDDSQITNTDKVDVNNAVSEARGKTHPGDPRRMLGSDTPKKTLQVKTVSWDNPDEESIDDMISSYWDDNPGDGSDQDFQ